MGNGLGGRLSVLSHQARSSGVWHGGVLGLNGLSPKMDNIALRLVKYARPVGMTCDACRSLPYSCWTLARGWTLDLFQFVIACRYFTRFVSLRVTVQAVRSHTKPKYITEDVKLMSLEASQGIPRTSEILFMSSKL